MTYEKTVWKNREVEKPRTFTVTENPDGTITLTPAEGEIIEEGTPIIADNMNNIEDGIEAAHEKLAELADLAGEGRTTETVKGNADALDAHVAESAIHKTSDVIRTETETKLKVEVVSSSVSETPDAGRIIFDTSQGKFFGGNGTGWV
jgi:hypothetical protein